MRNIEIPIGRRTPQYRFFEMLPGLLSYSIVIMTIVLSIVSPIAAAIFILGYDIMWFVKTIATSYRIIQGYSILKKAQKVNWLQRLHDLNDVNQALHDYHTTKEDADWQRARHYKNLMNVAANQKDYYRPDEVYNAVIVAAYNETRDTLEPTVKAIASSTYDLKNMIFIVAYEERGGDPIQELAQSLIAEYGHHFFYAAAVKHPTDLKDEVIGKGGNITYAGRFLDRYLDKQGINPDKVIVTTLDSDNRPHESYFAYLTYEYIMTPEHKHRAFQPIALFLNNIWDVPAPMRVLATGTSFWNIISALRPHLLRNFAAHSQGMSALKETDFWSVRTIVEDGHQYWRSYFTFDGDYQVIPIYVPIYQDAVLAETYKKTIKAQLIQLRRWAYGASDVAYVAYMSLRKDNKTPLLSRFAQFIRLLDGYVSWAIVSVIITLGGWAPLFLNNESSRSIVAHELPQIVGQLMSFAMLGLFLVVFVSMKMLPPRPARYKRRRNIFMILQWLTMPIVSIGYGSASAFNAQTRLLFGKYLDKFDVTTKAVKKG